MRIEEFLSFSNVWSHVADRSDQHKQGVPARNAPHGSAWLGALLFAIPFQLIYSVLKLLPVRRRVVFISRQTNRPSRDFIMLADEVARRDRDLEIVMLCHKMAPSPMGRALYIFEIMRQMFHLATAIVCVVDGYVIPVSILQHRKGLLVIQMWHALGAIKQFGYEALGRPDGRPAAVAHIMRMHRNYDVVLCGSPAMVPIFARAFDVSESIVKPLGLPRVDRLISADPCSRSTNHSPSVKGLVRRYPQLKDTSKLTILYVPTYRRGDPPELDSVTRALGTDTNTLIIKPHELDPSANVEDHIINATGVSVIDLLPLCDVVITDYSAVAFEACILDKPLYFYVPDIEEYKRDSGLSFDPLKIIPRVTSKDIAQIASWIDSGERNQEARHAFKDNFTPLPGEGCTERIANLLAEHITELEDHGIHH